MANINVFKARIASDDPERGDFRPTRVTFMSDTDHLASGTPNERMTRREVTEETNFFCARYDRSH